MATRPEDATVRVKKPAAASASPAKKPAAATGADAAAAEDEGGAMLGRLIVPFLLLFLTIFYTFYLRDPR